MELVRESAPMYYWPLERTGFIFSMVNRRMFEPYNIITLYMKYFVWKMKHRRQRLNLVAFQNYFNHELVIIKKAFRGIPKYDKLMQI